MKIKLVPYLNFTDQTAEAMKFYKSILGGELTMTTFGESGMPGSDELKDRIMHAELSNGEQSFMASDSPEGKTVNMGDSIHMSLVGDDDQKLTECFDKLSEGGKVDEPLVKAPWGDKFGMLTDKFGIHWMVNISSGEQK